jgi:hypothetical protein
MWMKEGFWMGDVFVEGGLTKEKLLEGELVKGGLLKGKELLKENHQRGIAKEGLIEFETLRKLKREHGTVQVCAENFIHRL